MKPQCLLSLCIAALLTILPLHASVAQTQTDTPEAAVIRYLEATKAQDWIALARLVHPDDLAAFRNLFVQAVDSAAAHEDDIAFLLAMTGMTSQDEVREMEPAPFFARFIGYTMEEQMGGLQDPDGSRDDAFESMTFSDPTRLNEVDGTIYLTVDISIHMGEEPLTYSEVMEVKQHESGWMIGITKTIQAMAYQLSPDDASTGY